MGPPEVTSEMRRRQHPQHLVAEAQPSQARMLRTRHGPPRYPGPAMGESEKSRARTAVNDRIRAHLRKAMWEEGLGIRAAAAKLEEDPGALTHYLNERAPSPYLIFRIQAVFDIRAKDLLNEDLAEERWKRRGAPGLSDSPAHRRKERYTRPSGASQGSGDPGKRQHS